MAPDIARAAPEGDGAPGIEITPEMVAAGADALTAVNLDFEMVEDAAVRIYRAMVLAKDLGRNEAHQPGD